MVATVAQLLQDPDLDLAVLAGEGALTTPVRWVAVSELEDPTPYLHGGELLLTTGMRLPRSRAAVDAYVVRLIGAGVVGLGYGIKIVRASVPAALVASARAHGLLLLEVDKPTPFIAISKAVADLVAAEQYRELTAGYEAQQEITRAAVMRGPGGVVTRLAALIGGWAVQLDAGGEVVHAAPADAGRDPATWEADLERVRGRGATALATSDTAGSRVVQSLGTGGRVTGYLVTGQAGPEPSPVGRHRATVNVAAALLSFATAQPERSEPGRAARAALVDLAATHPDVVGARLAELAGPVLAGDRAWVVVAAGDADARELLHRRLEDEGRSRCLPWATDDLVAVAVAGEAQLARVLSLVGDGLTAGVSDPQPPERIGVAVTRARQAQRAAAAAGERLRRFADLAGSGLVGLVEPAAAAALSAAILAPLTAYEEQSGVAMCASVRSWLARHGQLEPAAADLGVHRHTLRYRIRKAAELLGRDLDDPAVRMDLWFALSVRPTP